MLSIHQTSQDDDDSLTDVSLLIKSDSSACEEDQTTKSDLTDETLFRSLISYASSFNLDQMVCSMQDLKNQWDSSRSMQRKSSEIISSKIEDYNSDESTTITDGSKFQWENVFDAKDKQSKNKSMKSPIIVYEKLNDVSPSQDIGSRHSPKPIIVREVLKKPSLPTFAKPPIAPKRQKNPRRIPKKKVIDECNQQIQDQKEIKDANPYKYVQRYGTSAYTREIFRNLLTKIIV